MGKIQGLAVGKPDQAINLNKRIDETFRIQDVAFSDGFFDTVGMPVAFFFFVRDFKSF